MCWFTKSSQILTSVFTCENLNKYRFYINIKLLEMIYGKDTKFIYITGQLSKKSQQNT